MTKKILVALLVVATLFMFSVGVSAADNAAETTVTVSLQIGEDILLAPTETAVDAEKAESCGYPDAVDSAEGASALDALVTVHEMVYTDFAADPKAYLEVAESGMVTKVYGEETYSFCFMINGEASHSDVESAYGGYESYMVNQAVIADGDDVDFALSVDPYYMDNAVWFMQDGKRIDSLSVVPGESVKLQLQGYAFMWYSSYGTESIVNEHMTPIEEVQLAEVTVAEGGNVILEPLDFDATDEDGYTKISFDENGTHLITALVTDEENGFYGFYPFLKVDVVDPVETVVTMTMQDGENILIPPMDLTVYADMAESFGYNDTVSPAESVSVLDVLVYAHWLTYEGFDANPEDYLKVAESGMVSRVYGEDTYNFCFMVNGEASHSDVESPYGGYESYLVNQAPVSAGDRVEFALAVDPYYMDNAVWFMQDGKKVDALRAKVGEDIALQLQGYAFMWYSSYGTESIVNEYMEPIEGAELTCLNADEDGAVVPEGLEVTTDEEGNVTVNFDEPGVYTLSANVNNEEYGFYGFHPFITVTVVDPIDYSAMKDLKAGAWYKEFVQKMLENGYMNGTSSTTFAPDSTLTRAMFVTLLYRAAGQPAVPFAAPFEDVSDDDYFAAAVDWAYETGIVNGMSETKFSPNGNITREQMSAILDRYAQAYGIVLPDDQGEAAFSDADKISSWAKDSVTALAKAGIINGMGDGTFAPKKTATRAQAAKILCVFLGL